MKKILIVDDAPNFRHPVAAGLRQQGYEVFGAANGAEGLLLAETERPDLILLDLGMPVMDGMQCLKELRASEITRAIPVIMVTARAQPEFVIESRKLGVQSYLLKSSFSFGEILTLVQQHLGKPGAKV